jgi:hypothetical protein
MNLGSTRIQAVHFDHMNSSGGRQHNSTYYRVLGVLLLTGDDNIYKNVNISKLVTIIQIGLDLVND